MNTDNDKKSTKNNNFGEKCWPKTKVFGKKIIILTKKENLRQNPVSPAKNRKMN